MKTIQFFLDFDGTITQTDVVDLLLENFAPEEWKEIEKEWTSGKIGSRECLTKQVGLLQASPKDVEKLVARVQLDPHFVPFLKKAEELGVLVTIVSDGFDLLIEQILKKNLEKNSGLLKALPIFSNKLKRHGSGFKAHFANETVCEHGCANCKAAIIKRLTAFEDNVFFVGDGLSDRYAAQAAHLTFAKGKLLEYCREKKLDCIAYNDFHKITEWLAENHPMLIKASLRKN
jgi:2,3-diketo-5-methylthio-1-phosphopentane phosphatase